MAAYNDTWLDQVTDSAWEALHPSTAPETGGDPAVPETPASAPEATDEQPQYFETDTEGVVADADGGFYEAADDGTLTPYEYDDDSDDDAGFTPSELETSAFWSFLAREGVDLDTATAEQLDEAVQFADQFEDQLSEHKLERDVVASLDE